MILFIFKTILIGQPDQHGTRTCMDQPSTHRPMSYSPGGFVATPVQQQLVTAPAYHKIPQNIVCPYCHATVVTQLKYQAGGLSFLLCVLFPLCGCIPFCVNECKDVEHHCPNCGSWVGLYRRI